MRVAGGVNRALEIGVVDEVITPIDTRRRIAEALAAAPGRPRGARQHPAVSAASAQKLPAGRAGTCPPGGRFAVFVRL